jgi:hypothetical protein
VSVTELLVLRKDRDADGRDAEVVDGDAGTDGTAAAAAAAAAAAEPPPPPPLAVAVAVAAAADAAVPRTDRPEGRGLPLNANSSTSACEDRPPEPERRLEEGARVLGDDVRGTLITPAVAEFQVFSRKTLGTEMRELIS